MKFILCYPIWYLRAYLTSFADEFQWHKNDNACTKGWRHSWSYPLGKGAPWHPIDQTNEPCCWLEAANWLPDDIGTKIRNVLTTASVEAFHILIHNMHWELDKNPMAYSYSEIIQEEDVLYNRCIALKQWLQMSTEAKDKLFAMYADL